MYRNLQNSQNLDFLWGLFCSNFGNEFCWLLHGRTGISNLHELQKYSMQYLQTVWKKMSTFIINAC